MKLPTKLLTIQDQLLEFDIWITPSLGEIRDTERFREELARIVDVFNALAAATNNFESLDSCNPGAIAATYSAIAAKSADTGARLLDLASTLFLVSGKSDNNAKCQLPIYLRDRVRRPTFPRISRGRIVEGPIPRVLKAEFFMESVAGLSSKPDTQAKLLEAFIGFVLSDKGYIAQLWSIGMSFVAMKHLGLEGNLLAPLVTFQVRGSVSASGGHIPEKMIRESMQDWGMISGRDFNKKDAIVQSNHRAIETENPNSTDVTGGQGKTRAFDFILPFEVAGWEPHILIQSQFYAGDSGSVSHKNVDQTAKSRQSAAAILPNGCFVEYVDGAGYFASLNGDLRKLLEMPSTKSFTQIRTAPIRLRRELQCIGFLTPIEVAHASLSVGGEVDNITSALLRDGYKLAEVQRGLRQALEVGVLVQNGNVVEIPEHKRQIARTYLLLDIAAREGATLDPRSTGLKGQFLVPGYGPFHGLALDELAKHAVKAAPYLKHDWRSPEVILGDIRWLCERGYAMTG